MRHLSRENLVTLINLLSLVIETLGAAYGLSLLLPGENSIEEFVSNEEVEASSVTVCHSQSTISAEARTEAGAEAGAAVHVHHGAARCLLSLYEAAAEGLIEWAEFDRKAGRWGVDVRVTREDLAAVIEGSTRALPATKHRRLHQDAGDFARWGRRGGLKTLALYGRPYFVLLARLRWGRVGLEALVSYREALR